MLIIRLQRVGRTNDPSFRVIVTDSKNSAKTGNFLEIVGSYDARQWKPQLDAERIQHWIKNGTQVSDTVHNLLVKAKVIEGKIIVQIPEKAAEKAAEVLTVAPAKEATPAPAEEKVEVKEEEVPAEPVVEETPAEPVAPVAEEPIEPSAE